MDKAAVRREALARRDALPPEARARWSAAAAARVAALPEWREARTVASYVAIGSELDTRVLLDAALRDGKRLVVPRTVDGERALVFHEVADLAELAPGAFRVPEPDPARHADVDARDVALFVVPGVAFGRDGHRLGYGRGYFDRLLARVRGLKVGVTYGRLLLDEVPREPHDVPMDLVATEESVLDLRHNSYPRSGHMEAG